MSKKIKDVDLNQQIISNVREVNKNYIEQFPDNVCLTRDYYRSNGKFSEKEVNKIFGSFDNLKKEAFPELDSLSYKKKIHTLENENASLKKENNSILKTSIEEETLLEIYKENLVLDPKYSINYSRKNTKSNKDFLLCISDLHLGEVVIPEQVNFVNSFNKDIAIERLNTLFDKVIKYAKKIIVKDLHIEFNGDLFHGDIHLENQRNADLNVIESIFFLQKYITIKLCELTEHFDNIWCDVIVGNHARIMQGKPYFKEKVQMNWEYIFGKQLQAYFDLLQNDKRASKVHINVPESVFIIKKVKNTNFLVTHGDILSGGGTGGFSGLPSYGITMSSAKMYGVLHQIGVEKDTRFDHCLMGHLHTTAKIPIFNGGFAFLNGCICGTNEYSLFKIRSVAKTEQLLLILDDDGIDGEINVRL